jgi:excisionase family DNA binding protein
MHVAAQTWDDEITARMDRALALRHPGAQAHVARVGRYSALIAGRLGLDGERIGAASRLHDVGLIAMPDAIVLKPGPLTDEERSALRAHAAIGHSLLSGSGLAAEIALTHHERIDGSGYPDGLTEIPLAGRIVAVADTFDALSSDRVHRRAFPYEDAVARLRAERGRTLDAAAVDVLLEDLEALRALVPEPGAEADEPEPLLRMREAAEVLGVSPDQLRRWADSGRIASERTQGGHRRFTLAAVRALAAERGVRPDVRPLAPPANAVPALAQLLARHGPELALMAAGALYRRGTPGWFADASPARDEWLAALQQSARAGDYGLAMTASERYLRHAHLQAASLLERHRYLDFFSEAVLRALRTGGAGERELTDARRLLVALQQAQLAWG